MEGNPKVDKIMTELKIGAFVEIKLPTHIYNKIYDQLWKLVDKIDALEKQLKDK